MTPALLPPLAETFVSAFGSPHTVAVRAPGRANLIGDHTDYSNLPVLPMAIDRALLVLAAPTDDPSVEVHSLAFDPPARVSRDEATATAAWHGYLAGVLQQLTDLAPGRGARIVIGGDLPHTGGLSSSSALSMGLMAALNAAWDGSLDRAELARRAAIAERAVGVETGRMDQLVIAFAEAGAALRIDFEPEGFHPVPLPESFTTVVAYSGSHAPKAGPARDAYNERVVGARLAAAMLLDQLGFDIPEVPTLRDVWLADATDVLVDELPPQLAPREVAGSVGIDATVLSRLTTTTLDNSRRVPVRKIARHILSEAHRVDAAEHALRVGDLKAFGALLNESHDSLRNDMGCSTPALDKLCAAMRRAGAFGARLTGAGFGGYAVAAVPPDRVDAVIEAATKATLGPAFVVKASSGLELLSG